MKIITRYQYMQNFVTLRAIYESPRKISDFSEVDPAFREVV
jgi:hypothetical protein